MNALPVRGWARRSEHLTGRVDHGLFGVVANAAATERMHRDETTSEQSGPERIDDIPASHQPRHGLEACGDMTVDVVVRRTWPLDSKAIALEHHLPGAVMGSHGKECLRAGERAVADSADQAVDLTPDVLQTKIERDVADDVRGARHDRRTEAEREPEGAGDGA